jgi:hypothetical protein
MFASANETSGTPFAPLQESNATLTRRSFKTRVIFVASTAFLAGLVVFCFWPDRTEPSLNLAQFPEPASIEHANELLLNLPPAENEEGLYSLLVLPHLPVMYHQFLDSYGSTAPQLQQAMGTSLPVHALDDEEFNKRLKIFGENVKQIIEMNSHTSGHGADRAVFAINVFADWSKEEFSGLTTVKFSIPPHPSPSETASHAGALRGKRDSSCEDTASTSNCEAWRDAGYCHESSKYHPYMVTNCESTCGLCPTCKDSSEYCADWKGKGFCSKDSQYYNYMDTNCHKTCGLCSEGSQCDMKDCWSPLPGKYLPGYASQRGCFDVVEAMEKCEQDATCHGINKQYNECGGTKWTLRKGTTGLTASGYDASKLESKLLDRKCMERVNNNCDDNDGKSRNWAAQYEAAFEVRSQGSCGSCWAHSTAEMLRQHWTIKHLANDDVGLLSVQWMVDCVEPFAHARACNMGVGGCCGGWPWKALQTIHANGGLPTQKAYGPYLERNNNKIHPCNPRHAAPIVTTAGPKYLNGEEAMKRAILQDGSAGITIYASAFGGYAGGVFPASACGTNSVNHAVQLVGYIDEKKAWLVQNSWGTNWGVSRYPPYKHIAGKSGFILLQYGANTCHIAQVKAVMPNGVSRAQSAKGVSMMPPLPPNAKLVMSNISSEAQSGKDGTMLRRLSLKAKEVLQ